MQLKALVHTQPQIVIRQRMEVVEFFGFESRNKYEVYGADGQLLGFVAEQQKGILGFLLRQFIGHWRSFSLHFFDYQRGLSFIAHHPFRFFFKRLEVTDNMGRRLGALQQRFAILRRKFDVEDAMGRVILNMEAGIFSFWTFPIFRASREVAAIKKQWSGALTEIFTDRDNFAVEFKDPALTGDEKALLLAAAIFIDLQYFEQKANTRGGFTSST